MSSPWTAAISCSRAGGRQGAGLARRPASPRLKAISVGIEVICAAAASRLLGLGVDGAEEHVGVRLATRLS